MKKILPVFFLLTAIQILAQTEDKRIEQIRQAYKQVNEQIAESEKNFAESEIFLTELVVNKGGTSYPAVGYYKETVKFFYTFGSREEKPYPNRLLKIVSVTNRSGQVEYTESLYSPAGQLIFYYEKIPDAETGVEKESRLYLADGKLIRYQAGEKVENAGSAKAKTNLRLVLRRQKRLMNIFQNSLE
jgi:hypothetical protein